MGLVTEWIRYGENKVYKGYMARPELADHSIPAIIVLQEIWGVDAHIQDVTRRFAEAGYVALAPDVFSVNGERPEDLTDRRLDLAKRFLEVAPRSALQHEEEREKALRQFPEADRPGILQTLSKLFGGLDSEAHAKQVLTTAKFLREANEFSRGRGVGAVGFCMGGALSAQLACRDPELKAAVIFYGRAPKLEQLDGIRCPVFGYYGELDEHITGGVADFAEQMKAKGKSFEHHIYPGAKHAFFNDTRSSYNVEASRDAFVRTLRHFRELVAQD